MIIIKYMNDIKNILNIPDWVDFDIWVNSECASWQVYTPLRQTQVSRVWLSDGHMKTHVIKIALFTKIKSTLGHSYFIFTKFTDPPTQFFRVMKINLMIFLTCFILFSGKFMSFHKGFIIYNESGLGLFIMNELPWIKHVND